MSEKPPVFTVTDRRKFTFEGDLREEESTPTAKEEAPAPTAGPKVVTMPSPKSAEKPEPVATPKPEQAETPKESEQIPELTEQEESAAHHAYQQSSEHIDTMLRAANPGMGASPAVTMEHVIQSIYLSAVVALGAATEQGQKPRIDILGARQSIDMLGVLQEKTKGNLNEKEQRMLQNALFELRMMFLEVTNAIAQQAAKPPQGKK